MNNCNSTGEWIGIGLPETGIAIGIVGLILISMWGIINHPGTKLWIVIGIVGVILGIISLFYI